MEFSGCGFKSHSGQLSVATLKILSEKNTICFSSFKNTHAHVITYGKSLKKINVATDKGKQPKRIVTLKLEQLCKVGSESELNS